MGVRQSGRAGADCKSVGYAWVGSNPTTLTKRQESSEMVDMGLRVLIVFFQHEVQVLDSLNAVVP